MLDDFNHADNRDIGRIISNIDTRLGHFCAAHAEALNVRLLLFQLKEHVGGVLVAGRFSGAE